MELNEVCVIFSDKKRIKNGSNHKSSLIKQGWEQGRNRFKLGEINKEIVIYVINEKLPTSMSARQARYDAAPKEALSAYLYGFFK